MIKINSIEVKSIQKWTEDKIDFLDKDDFQYEIKEVQEFERFLIDTADFSYSQLRDIAKIGMGEFQAGYMDFEPLINNLMNEVEGWKEEFLKFAKKIN